MDIFSQVKSLNLPSGHYAVTSSGVMAAYGIRDFKDIDLLVTPVLYNNLKKDGWKEKVIRLDFVVIEKDIFEASPNMMTLSNYKPDINLLIKNADLINGVAFVQLTDVVDFKKALGRPKDIQDIELIKDYLKKKNNT